MDYAESKSALEFARYVRLNFIGRGYYFYVTGRIPDHKNPVRTDAKIIAQYELNLSKWARARQRRRGIASVRYLRFGREFIILATRGEHRFFQEEAHDIRDVRRKPLKIGNYHIHRQWKGRKISSVSSETKNESTLKRLLPPTCK